MVTRRRFRGRGDGVLTDLQEPSINNPAKHRYPPRRRLNFSPLLAFIRPTYHSRVRRTFARGTQFPDVRESRSERALTCLALTPGNRGIIDSCADMALPFRCFWQAFCCPPKHPFPCAGCTFRAAFVRTRTSKEFGPEHRRNLSDRPHCIGE